VPREDGFCEGRRHDAQARTLDVASGGGSLSPGQCRARGVGGGPGGGKIHRLKPQAGGSGVWWWRRLVMGASADGR